MATVSVRYTVQDVDAAIAFYTRHLGFHEEMHPAPTFAMLSRGDLRLLLSAPSGAGGGGQAMPDGTMPEPGGWNRFSLEVSDLAAMVEELRKADVHFRNDIVTGVGGKQVLVDDPSGSPNRAVRTVPARGLAFFSRNARRLGVSDWKSDPQGRSSSNRACDVERAPSAQRGPRSG
jgi:catechol 2,3-dioxygenase-like lactoylglutathione lyase family enzyme